MNNYLKKHLQGLIDDSTKPVQKKMDWISINLKKSLDNLLDGYDELNTENNNIKESIEDILTMTTLRQKNYNSHMGFIEDLLKRVKDLEGIQVEQRHITDDIVLLFDSLDLIQNYTDVAKEFNLQLSERVEKLEKYYDQN